MNINLRSLSNTDKNYLEVIDLYKIAFPEARNIPTWFLRYKLRKGKEGFSVIYMHDTWVGLIYITEYKDLIFVQYLAIAESYRSAGYGSLVMDYLKHAHTGKRIVLNIEELDPQTKNYKQRVKRKAFYEKNGFISSGYIVKEPGEQLEMLIFGGSIAQEEIEAMYKKFFGSILGLLIKPKIIKI
jgi:GNAT superfamily N-acetyltransferase